MGLRAELQKELVKRSTMEPQTRLSTLENIFGIDRIALKYELMQLYKQGIVFGVIMGDFLAYFGKDDNTIPNLQTMLGVDPEQLTQEYMKRQETKFNSNGTAGVSDAFNFMTSFSREQNKENNLILQVRSGFKGAKISLYLTIENLNDWQMEKLTIKIEVPSILRFFKLTNEDLQVDFLENNIMLIRVPAIDAKQTLNILVLFKAVDLGNVEFKGNLQFYNAQNKVRFIPIEPIGLKLTPPLLTKIDKSIEIDVKEYVKGEKKKKNILSFGLPEGADPKIVFKNLLSVLTLNNFKELAIVENEERLIGTFYGEFEQAEKRGDLLAIVQIFNGKYELYACSEFGFAIATILTKLSLEIRKRFDSLGILKNNAKIIDLNCIKCDVPLVFNPKKGEEVSCVKCGTKQIPNP